MVSVRDVAREAGVSVASVSRVVNMPEKVGAEVRRRVEAAIDKLHYIPSGAGRALTTQRSRIIGALGPHIAFVIYSAVVEAVQRRLALDHYSLVLGLAGYEREPGHARRTGPARSWLCAAERSGASPPPPLKLDCAEKRFCERQLRHACHAWGMRAAPWRAQ
jgi:hypothetical protein